MDDVILLVWLPLVTDLVYTFWFSVSHTYFAWFRHPSPSSKSAVHRLRLWESAPRRKLSWIISWIWFVLVQIIQKRKNISGWPWFEPSTLSMTRESWDWRSRPLEHHGPVLSKNLINKPKWPDFQNSSCYLHWNSILMGVNVVKKHQISVISKS